MITDIDSVKFTIDNPEAYEAICGSQNKNIKKIETLLSVYIGSRGNTFYIKGKSEQVNLAYNTISSLEKLIEKKSLQECVKLLGYQEKPQYFLKALDLFVLSSDSKEGVPQSLIQALMMGLPSIATDVGSVKDLYKRDNFILVSPNSIESLNQKMIELYKDQNQRETLAKKAPSSIKEFTQDSMANRIYKIYKMLLEK